MSLAEPLLAEFSHESSVTRRMLLRVPENKLSWQPHEKSMSLARLATHIAEIPGWATAIIEQDDLDMAASAYKPVVAVNQEELLKIFDDSVAVFQKALAGRPDEHLLASWKLRNGEQVIVELPRIAAIRGFVFSHVVHHRGQLSVYLRLNDVAVPVTYGPTADEGGGF